MRRAGLVFLTQHRTGGPFAAACKDVPDDATHACMQNQLQSNAAPAADRTKSDLLTRAAQRRREMEQSGRMLAEPAVIDEQPVLMRGNSIAPMWSAIHD